MRGLAFALLLFCAGCSSFWARGEGDYFADLAALAPLPAAAPAPAAARTPQPPTPPALPLAIEEPSVVDFACADGSRLRVTYSEDRRTAAAQWNDGAPIALERADRDGLIRYASLDAQFWRAGRRVAWEGAGEAVVRPGDTLWRISERVFGTRSRGGEIAQLNEDRIADPNLIYPGQRLRLPGGERRQCVRPITPRAT